jgi:ABC-type dipeptide/oligopeptide/nickel transport system permease component
MMQRFPYTLMISGLSLFFSILIGIPLGVYAATNQYTWKDNAAILISLFCVSMPAFWFALLMVQFFAVNLRILRWPVLINGRAGLCRLFHCAGVRLRHRKTDEVEYPGSR